MPKFRLQFCQTVPLVVLILTTGCSSLLSRSITNPFTASSVALVSEETPSTCAPIDPLTQSLGKATRAASLAQSAQSPQDWDLVILSWMQAIEAMQSIPPDNPKRTYAQKKIVEYFKQLESAQQKAKTSHSYLPFASFNNPIFDEQVLLYLSYIAAVGPPDILIVGSSRALVGIDPQQLQQRLAEQGKGELKIFNFSVNGATAQFVDFQLRQLLTPQQLPRLIIWADGVRAFNSRRVDKTYNSLMTSNGYQQLLAGYHPTLPEHTSNTTNTCETSSISTDSLTHKERSNVSKNRITSPWLIQPVSLAVKTDASPIPHTSSLLTQRPEPSSSSPLSRVPNTASYSAIAIDANGFLAMETKFDPKTYYQQNPRVIGLYDADYQPFSLSGQQSVAFDAIQTLTQQRQIPLVVVNLPISKDYLDSVRLMRERQFRQLMQQKAANGGFIFIDLAEQWLNQNQYFTDPSHLNRYGAAAVANQLASTPQIPWPQSYP